MTDKTKNPSRRLILKSSAAAGIALSGAGIWRANEQGLFSIGQGPAYDIWDLAPTPQPETVMLLQAAVLGASPHNTQPWLFSLEGETITVWADHPRHLGTMDPYLREMYIGLGCAIESARLLAASAGRDLSIEVIDAPLSTSTQRTKPVQVARLTLKGSASDTLNLAAQIPHRHTNRYPYLPDKPVPQSFLTWAVQIAGEMGVGLNLWADGFARQQINQLIVQATEAIVDDTEMAHDSAAWTRLSKSEIATHRDGVTMESAGLSPGLFILSKMVPKVDAHTSHMYWLAATRDSHVPTAAMVGTISVGNLYSAKDSILAGRFWQHMHLGATKQGLAMHPLNQPIEMIDRQRQLGKAAPEASLLAGLIERPGHEPTFSFRIGYPTSAAQRSPRRAIDGLLI